MYLKHLTINGFKSFAKKSELEFSAPITAIVGPNGSGKSNVAESFRFVLGEQAPSKMRGKKGEDLIWGGSDQVSRGNRAGVTVTLDNRKRVFGLDFDEIVLERVVHRDGQNEYLINGSQVRLKDVQELLAAANIGPSGHHMISQGEADRVLSASPKERKEMVEDALGLKVYQLKKAEAEKKLEKTKENIERVEGIRREVAPHLKFLTSQVKKLERAAEMREKLKVVYAEYLKREESYLNHAEGRFNTEYDPLKKELSSIETKLAAARKTLEAKESDQRRDELMRAENTLSKARGDRQDIIRRVSALEGQIQYLNRRVAEEKRRAERQTNPDIPYAEIEKLVIGLERDAERAAKLDDIAGLRRGLNDLIRTLRQFLSRSMGAKKENNDDKELTALEKEKGSLDREQEEAAATEAKAEAEYQKIRKEIEADASESREAERLVFALINDRREVEGKLAKFEYEKQAMERDREEFKRELKEAVALLGRAATEYANFRIDVDMDEDRETQRQRRRELEKLKVRLEEMGGANAELEQEYKNVKERDDFLVREIEDLRVSVGKLESLIDEMEAELEERFGEGIVKISAEFNRFFSLMFGGGSAELTKVKIEPRRKAVTEDEEVEEEAPKKVESGLEVSVKLPNKRVKGLEVLSGGERALTSIALIFAMSQVNPPLFIILDETDAALDEANSRRYGDMIEALAKRSQLILITHNRETMSRAGILYGVTMSSDGVSKLLSVKLEAALAVAK